MTSSDNGTSKFGVDPVALALGVQNVDLRQWLGWECEAVTLFHFHEKYKVRGNFSFKEIMSRLLELLNPLSSHSCNQEVNLA